MAKSQSSGNWIVSATFGLSERGLCLLPVVCRLDLHTGDSSIQGGFPDTPRNISGGTTATNQISPLPMTTPPGGGGTWSTAQLLPTNKEHGYDQSCLKYVSWDSGISCHHPRGTLEEKEQEAALRLQLPQDLPCFDLSDMPRACVRWHFNKGSGCF